MLRIRLRRVGRKKQPSYRIVIAESTAPRDGKFVEMIGFYNPRTEPETVQYQEARALHWLSHGAQPSDAVRRMFERGGTIDRLARLRAGESLEALAAEADNTAATETSTPVVVIKAKPATNLVEVDDVSEASEDVSTEDSAA